MLKLLSLSAISVLLAVTGATALEGRFDRPKYKGGPARLDVCDHFAKACGQPAADDFCQMMGYARASKFETEHATPTRVMNFGQECQGAGCAAFKHRVLYERGAEGAGKGLAPYHGLTFTPKISAVKTSASVIGS